MAGVVLYPCCNSWLSRGGGFPPLCCVPGWILWILSSHCDWNSAKAWNSPRECSYGMELRLCMSWDVVYEIFASLAAIMLKDGREYRELVNCRANRHGKPRAVSANWFLWSFSGGNCSQHYAYTLSEREQFATDKNKAVVRQLSNTWTCLMALWYLTVYIYPKNQLYTQSLFQVHLRSLCRIPVNLNCRCGLLINPEFALRRL